MNGSIKGTWVVDTDLKVPEALLAPSPSTGERNNLSLTSFNGPITADVAFLSQKPSRASILLDTKNGEISLNVVCEIIPVISLVLTLLLLLLCKRYPAITINRSKPC